MLPLSSLLKFSWFRILFVSYLWVFLVTDLWIPPIYLVCYTFVSAKQSLHLPGNPFYSSNFVLLKK